MPRTTKEAQTFLADVVVPDANAATKAMNRQASDARYHMLGGTDVPVADGGTGQSTAAAARGASGLNIDHRVTFSNADYTITATDRYVAQIGTMSTDRVATLPAASAVPAGYEITVVDESGTVTSAKMITVARAGSDTLVNPANRFATTSVLIRQPDAVTLRSDGTSKWFVVVSGLRRPFAAWSHAADVAIPTSVWTPLPWNLLVADEYGVSPNLQATATTIAAASNGNVLPQATITVASTTGFLSAGYLVITAPPGAGDDTVVSYTGKTSTTFTGCNSAYRGGGVGISTGTLATSQVVTQANVEWVFPTGYLWSGFCDLALASIATTAYFGLRFRVIDDYFNAASGTNHYAGVNIALQHGQVISQPTAEAPTGVPTRVEVFQSSGSVKLSKTEAFAAPLLNMGMLSTR